ncbi:MAG: helix-turn-helix domain-containing protein [Rhodocyclaceae bacterium]
MAASANIAILVFPETSASVVYGMVDLFASAGRDWGLIVEGRPGPQLLSSILVGREVGLVIASNDVPIAVQAALGESPPMEIVCVPEVNLPPGTPLAERFAPEIAWLRQRFEAGATLATACSGAMLLAEAGLLAGCEATTHWAWCDVLARDYPAVRVQAQRALVVTGESGRLVMAGGGSSWLDLALYLIARLAGMEAAMQVARLNLIDWHSVGQQPFACLARSRQVDDAAIARCQTWIADHYMDPAPVAAMVQLSGMPERSFKRRFHQATGMPPLEYVHTLRIEEAKQMLEASAAPVEAIAQEVGYEDAGFFGRLFRRRVNLTPVQYRRRFQGMRRALG